MKPKKLDLRYEVSRPFRAWRTEHGIADYLFETRPRRRLMPQPGKTIIARIITERAWQEIRKELKGKH